MSDLFLLKRLMDSRWYVARHPEAAPNPLKHFVSVGLAAGYDPNPLFDGAWYGKHYADALRPGESALENFLRSGAAQGYDPGPLFDTQWYLSKNPDVAEAGGNPLDHYLTHGADELRDPSPLFDSRWYFANYPEARAPGLDAYAHFMSEGYRLDYSPSAFFDTKWYREAYPEVAATGENPLLHYLLQGSSQGYSPGPHFDTQAFVAQHPECAQSGKNPLVLFLLDEEGYRLASAQSVRSSEKRPSREAMSQIDALTDLFSDIEIDLGRLAGGTALFPVHEEEHDVVQRWRALYLSLFALPKLIVFVGSIDDTPRLAQLAAHGDGLLIVETDGETASTAGGLPRGVQWRAFAEFGPLPDLEARIRLATALVNNLQPGAVLVWGSEAGWEMLARHGRALGHNTRLFATASPLTQADDADPLRIHFRNALPALTALYGADTGHLERTADLFGLPRRQREKLKPLDNWARSGGFLSMDEAVS